MPFTSIDLFCGAGGITLGLHDAGFSTAVASDFWLPAVQTFRENFAVPILHEDARDLTAPTLLAAGNLTGPPDLVVGGPPCQGFSSAGAREDDDHRNSLVGVFASLVCDLRPKALLFENVEGFLTAAGGAYVVDLLDPLIEAGYKIRLSKVNVANWGVPQLRKRVICVGLLGSDPEPLRPTHRAWGAPGVHLVGTPDLQATPTVREALDGLPPSAHEKPGIPEDHWSSPLSSKELERVVALRPGDKMKDLPEHLQHASYQRRANRRVADGTATERRGGAPAGVRRLEPDEPSKAITSAASREFIHPFEDRPLTLRECARLQTFPDEFRFQGTRQNRCVQIGNAVPPLFAAGIAESLKGPLEEEGPAAGRGALVGSTLTVSGGRSPALQKVAELLESRYLGTSKLGMDQLWA